MANELRFQAQFSITAPSGPSISGSRVRTADLATDGQYAGQVQNVGTSAEALDVGDVAGKLLYVENRGDLASTPVTHKIQLALDNTFSATSTFAELYAGDANVYSLPAGATVYAKAIGGAVDLYFVIAERA